MRDVVDTGLTPEYDTYFRAYPCPQLTTPKELVLRIDDDEDDEDENGEGRWRRQRREGARGIF